MCLRIRIIEFLTKFQKAVIFFSFLKKNAFFIKKIQKMSLAFNFVCYSLIQKRNSEDRFKALVIYNEIHVFKTFSIWDLYRGDP